MGLFPEMCKPAARQEDLGAQLLGTWSYCVVGRYQISRAQDGQLLFLETHSDGKEVSGILRGAEDVGRSPVWQFQADIFAHSEFCGLLRMHLAEDSETLVTIFRPKGSVDWAREVSAQRLPEKIPVAPAKQDGVPEIRCWPSTARRKSDPTRVGCAGLAKWLEGRRPELVAARAETSSSLVVVDAWELQRRTAPFSSAWQAPFLPHDKWQGLSRWVDKEFQRHPWVTGTDASCDEEEAPPLGAPRGWSLDDSRWRVAARAGSAGDAQGWQYALDFAVPETQWGEDFGIQCCRRRLWQATLVKGEEAPEVPPLPLPLDSGFAVVADEEVAGLNLEVEAERLLADDWVPGNLIVDLLAAAQVYQIEAAPWLDDEPGGVRVREVNSRIAVPPNPLAPESSRANIRYQVLVERKGDATTITFQGTWSVLDVPYGEYFHTVERIALAPSAGGARATKAMKVDFVKSTLFQSVIESTSASEAEKSAPVFLGVVRSRTKG